MTPAESKDLQEKANRACMSVSQLLRLLIAGYQPPPAPDEEFHKDMDKLLQVSDELIALSKKVKFGEAADLMRDEALAIRKFRRELERKYLSGERRDPGWQ
jgi:hypothetical protein